MDELWKLVYSSFENGMEGAWKSVTASNTMRNEIQFRLQNNLATYKRSPNVKLLDEIEADIQLCATLGFVTTETANRALEIIEKQGT